MVGVVRSRVEDWKEEVMSSTVPFSSVSGALSKPTLVRSELTILGSEQTSPPELDDPTGGEEAE